MERPLASRRSFPRPLVMMNASGTALPACVQPALLCAARSSVMNSNHTILFSSLKWFRVALALALQFIATSAVAQIDRAVLEGTVSDPSGRVIVGATVKVVAVDTGLTQEQATNSKGYYRFPGLAVGRY